MHHQVVHGTRGQPWVMAHRGAPHIATENTLTSFEAALRLGVEAVELDVHLTRDSRLAVHHDEELGRTIEGRGALREFTMQELRRFRVVGGKRGERMPTLEEAIDLCRGRCHLAIEAKTDFPQAAAFARVLGHSIRRVLPKRERNTVTAISFCQALIGHMRESFPDIPAGPSFEKKHSPAAALYFRPSAVIAAHEIVDAAWIAPYHKARVPVWVFTVDDKKEWNRLARLGASAIITNRPDLFVRRNTRAGSRGRTRGLSPSSRG